MYTMGKSKRNNLPTSPERSPDKHPNNSERNKMTAENQGIVEAMILGMKEVYERNIKNAIKKEGKTMKGIK